MTTKVGRSLTIPIAALLVLAACGGATAPTSTPTPMSTVDVATPTADARLSPAAATAAPTSAPLATASTPQPTGGTSQPPPVGVEPDASGLATGTTPAGWVEVRSTDGGCRIAAPADWYTDVMPGTASSPEFEAQAILGHDAFTDFGGNWDSYLELIRNTYIPGEIVLLRTDEKFLMRSPDTAAELTYLAVLNRGSSGCSLLASVKGNSVAEFRSTVVQILETLGAAS